MTAGAAAFVLANSTLRPVPLVPEISLYLAADAFSVWEAAERELGGLEQPPPFWAFAWPGGQALARYLLDHPEHVAGRAVLDLGSGSGVAAIAAAMAGASIVVASELDAFARAAIELNAAANQVPVALTGDVLDGAGGDASVVLAADVWYERQLADRAIGLLRRAQARGAEILTGDVGRAFLPRSALRQLACYDVPVIAQLEDAAVKRVLILTLL
jgi:predicted nicotinamide N-methyase